VLRDKLNIGWIGWASRGADERNSQRGILRVIGQLRGIVNEEYSSLNVRVSHEPVVESASCQSCQQDLYKGERSSHVVSFGSVSSLYSCRPSFCVPYSPVSLFASEYFGCDLPTASASHVFTVGLPQDLP
jgi:hypothetical protein